jgi:hypothetical protein
LKWRKTSRDISVILKYINEGETEQPKEDSMTELKSKDSILIDIAGMGKSTVLNHLAQQLKKKNANHWVVKVDLNDHTSQLDEVKSNQLKTSKEAIGFLSNKILKLSSEFEKDLFRYSCEFIGNVVLLFDGYDEVASFYRDQVTQLIRSLLQSSIGKFFIASRPECADYLEKEFLQIRHSLQPFSKENQESYLLHFMKEKIKIKDDDALKEIIGIILSKMSGLLSDQDFKFTGVPLITKLVAEFFESKIREYFQEGSNKVLADFTTELDKESFSLVQLYDHFVDKKLQVYYEENCGMDPSKSGTKMTIQREKKKIFETYETLAVQQILKTDLGIHLPTFRAKKIDEDDLEVLVQVGLVYKINNEFKFVHQTYGEFGFNKFLDRNLDNKECAIFICKVVLIDSSYRIIRSFVNAWILDRADEKTCEMYQKRLLKSSVKGREETQLHVAGLDGNQNIFWFLYSSLVAKTKYYKSKKSDLKNYLLRIDDCPGYTALVYYFRYCNDDSDILSAIHKDLKAKFVRRVFTLRMYEGRSLLHEISHNDSEHILKVLGFLSQEFSGDPRFLKEVILSQDDEGKSFLFDAFECLKSEVLVELLEELKRSELSERKFKKLFLMKSLYGSGVFLSNYAESKYFDNGSLLQFLKQLKILCDEETLKEFFLVVNEHSRTLLHEFCMLAKDFDLLQTLKWVAEELGQEFLLKLISLQVGWDKTIFHYFLSSSHQSNPVSEFLKILEFLHQDLGLENKVLLDILTIEDRMKKETCLDLICKKGDRKITEILDFLSKVFQNDGDWLRKLFKEKLRENEEVKEWMGKNNLNVDLFDDCVDLESDLLGEESNEENLIAFSSGNEVSRFRYCNIS